MAWLRWEVSSPIPNDLEHARRKAGVGQTLFALLLFFGYQVHVIDHAFEYTITPWSTHYTTASVWRITFQISQALVGPFMRLVYIGKTTYLVADAPQMETLLDPISDLQAIGSTAEAALQYSGGE